MGDDSATLKGSNRHLREAIWARQGRSRHWFGFHYGDVFGR